MKPVPPSAPKRRIRPKSALHTPDPWQWLEDLSDPATLDYLKAENAYVKKVMRPKHKLRQTIYEELKGRVAEDDISFPEKDGEYWYYTRYKKDHQYPLYCRKLGTLDAPERVYLDHNKLGKEHKYCELGFVDLSIDHRYVAYGIDTEGDERFTILIKDIKTGRALKDQVKNASTCFEWKGNEGFFYVKLDENDRPLEVYYHLLGTAQDQDKLIYKESDSRFFVGLDGSESEEYIFISCHSYDANEVHYHRIADQGCQFHLIEPRRSGHEYEVSHRGDDFYILTNWDAENFRLMRTPVTQPSGIHWQNLQDHNPKVLIEGILVFRDFYLVDERENGLTRIKLVKNGVAEPIFISFDEEAYEIGAYSGRDFACQTFRYVVSSPRHTPRLLEYDTTTQQSALLKKRAIPDKNFDEENYRVRRIFANSRDGKKIPLTILHHKNFGLDQARPMLIHAYGSYGETLDTDFSSYRFSLVDRGFIVVLAHIRGGMEMGRDWYLSGKLDKKWNSFYDFIDSCQFLIDSKFTNQGWIIAEGGSAGGLLMGVAVNEKPELFLGVVAAVPFVDVLNTMLDETLPLTKLEYNEWGNPQNPKDHSLIKSYSPYENIKKQSYPHMLVTAGLQDKRVCYWEAAKWVAKLRHTKTDKNILLLRTELSSGHGGSSGRYDAMREIAEELSFMVMLSEDLPSN